jgi:hypothetical protein
LDPAFNDRFDQSGLEMAAPRDARLGLPHMCNSGPLGRAINRARGQQNRSEEFVATLDGKPHLIDGLSIDHGVTADSSKPPPDRRPRVPLAV